MDSNRGGERLRQWLRENGHTQASFAKLIGTHQTNVSAWILGRPLSLESAIAIRTETGIPVEAWVQTVEPRRRVAKSA